MLTVSALLLATWVPARVPLVAGPTSAELSLRGQYRVSPGWGKEFLATLNLSLPLSRLGAPGWSAAPTRAKQPGDAGDEAPKDDASQEPRPQASDAKPSRADPPGEASEQADDDSAPSAPASAAPARGKTSKRPGERAKPPRLTPQLAEETVQRALEHAGFDRARARLGSMVSRARYSALLPDLRLRAARRNDETLRLTPTLDDPYRYTLAGGSDLTFEASLTWRFDQLLFGSPELSAERLRAQYAERMQALARQVLDALFDWQRARLAGSDPGALPEERERAALDELEARTRLFVMTGGWFGTTPAFKTR